MLITFEGIEGSGKTTQVKMLASALQRRGFPVVVTREPGGTAIGDEIRKTLLNSKNKNMVPLCEVLLYYAARAQHVAEVIVPHREKNIILCDRFEESTLAYQGAGRKIEAKILAPLGNIVLQGLKSDLTLIFDLPVEMGLRRALSRGASLPTQEREDRFENEVISFHETVREGYLALAKLDCQRFKVLDATKEAQDLHAEVLGLVEKVI